MRRKMSEHISVPHHLYFYIRDEDGNLCLAYHNDTVKEYRWCFG